MQIFSDDSNGRVLSWLVDEPLDLPAPPGMEWMTPEQLVGYYLLYRPDADAHGRGQSS
ncbi:MAG: hypothetical protein M3042_07765 [Actinomycetota bacterium]|nr:hypothetical protein [Actinomycetota bacterium]